MIKGIILIAFMVVIMVLMVTRKVPTLIAIPILAIGIAVIAGVPLTGEESIISTVIQSGAVKLAGSYTACLIATWMSCIMQRTGITENMIRKAAELGGDKTNVVAILLFLVICALSTVMSGLGAVIMMGTIAIPILISVGVEKFTAAAILLCAYGAGEHFGMVRATYFAEVFGLEVGQVYLFSVVVAITTGIAGLLYIITRLRKNGKKFAFSAPVSETEGEAPVKLKGVRGALAMLTPFVPIAAVVGFKWDVIPAFLLGILWALIFTAESWKKTCNITAKTCYDGFLMGAPCAALMFFIGMLLNAINTSMVKDALAPLISNIVPASPVAFAALFIVLTPLVLYRGPLNMYGLGAGIAALMASLGTVAPAMVCVGFLGVAAVQDTSCPTNTHNVWAAGFVEEDVTQITKAQILWMWAAAAVAIIIGTIMFWG